MQQSPAFRPARRPATRFELAEYPRPGALAEVSAAYAGIAHTIGLSLAEPAIMRPAGDPADALRIGNLLAASRARHGITWSRSMNPLIDPGKVRGLQRVTSADGYFLICALDHLSDFAELLAPDPASVTFADVVTAKDAVVRAMAPSISAVLLDPLYALGHLVASGAVPGTVGLMSSIEDEDYRHPDGPRRTRLRGNWNATRIKMAGADMCKLLWFYRPDGDQVVAEQQRQVVADLVAECAELSLPLVVEPIWYLLPGEDPTTAQWKADRVRGIIASAAAADRLGVDMLKVEFPGYVDTAEGRAQAATACAELDSMVSVPWVILSAGVGYDDFKTQVEIACQAGAAGYLAGRSIWRDAVSTHDAEARNQAIEAARARLEELNAVTRRYGRSYTPARPLDEVVKELPAEWYRTWHA